jgi:DHA1 family tetracycline resistance protein-like MFS transporter
MKAVLPVFITLLLDVMGFGLLIPVAPKLVAKVMGVVEADSAFVVGSLMSLYAAMQFVFAPILGALSDRFGRRPVLLVALFGSGLDYFALALAPSLPWLFLTRALNGISGASFTVANAYIADVTPPEKRAAGYGIVGAAFGLGFVLGPLVGGVLGEKDIHWPFYAAGGLTLLNAAYALFLMPESLSKANRSPFSLARANPLAALLNLRKYPTVLGLASALFCCYVADGALRSTWAVYTGVRYGWDSVHIGLSLAVVGLCAAFVQGFLSRKIIPKLGEPRSLMFGMASAVLAYCGYGLATQGWMIYAIVAVASIGGIAMPAGQSIITRSVSPTEQGLVQGSLGSVQSVAFTVGPLLGSWLLENFGRGGRAEGPLAGVSFFAGAGLYALGLFLAWRALSGIRAGLWDRSTPKAGS